MRRRRPPSEAVARAAAALKRIESHVALLDRVRPRNLEAERARLLAAWRARRTDAPRFEYPARADLKQARDALEALSSSLDDGDAEQALLRERAAELALEAELSECVGTSLFRQLSARRFPLGQEHASLYQAARAATEVAATSESSALHVSDDRQDPDSLWSLLCRRIEDERLPVRLEVTPGLVALAAVAEGVVRLRPGARLSAAAGRRIALHEIEGHVLPRLSGRALGGVFWAGSARASEDEEGRAIWLEQRAGLLGAQRHGELGRRYLAAHSVREGAELWQTVRLLVEQATPDDAAIELACRVHRGGGLGRELIYLSGYHRVSRAFAERAELALVLAHGRLSIVAAGRMLDAGSVELDDDRDVI